MRPLLLALVLTAWVVVPAHAACDQDLAATAEFGALLEASQAALQRQVSGLRAELAATRAALGAATKKPEPEKPANPQGGQP